MGPVATHVSSTPADSSHRAGGVGDPHSPRLFRALDSWTWSTEAPWTRLKASSISWATFGLDCFRGAPPELKRFGPC